MPTDPGDLDVGAEPGHRAAARAYAMFDDVPSARTGFATLQGVDVHYVAAGTDGPALLFFHHFYGNVRTWRRLFAELAGDGALIAFDRPGFGWTERLPRSRWGERHPYRRSTIADMAVDLLDHLGHDQAVLVGSSAGGTVALETLARHPDRVRGLVLLSPAITGDVGPPAALRPLLRSRPLRALGRRIVRRMARRGIDATRVGRSWSDPSKVTELDVATYAGPLDAPDWDVGLWDSMNADQRPNHVPTLKDAKVPILFVAGSDDRVIHPRWSRRAARHTPTGRYVELDNCGHTPQEECPGDLAVAIRAFLAELA